MSGDENVQSTDVVRGQIPAWACLDCRAEEVRQEADFLAAPCATHAQAGLSDKFKVERLTPSSRGIDHSECRYFVLDPEHDPIALAALTRYAQVARGDGRLALADDLDQWVHDLIEDDDCPHDWTCRPESDTWVCEMCGAER